MIKKCICCHLATPSVHIEKIYYLNLKPKKYNMEIIKWVDTYSVGVEEIDSQHKRIVKILNELYSAMSVGKGRDILERILGELTDYAVQHFYIEEKKMMVNGYPEYKDHKKKHGDFVDRIQDFKNQYTKGNSKITIELVNFLKDWLVNHITTVDKQLGDFLLEKGA